jgi:hypothetical protein
MNGSLPGLALEPTLRIARLLSSLTPLGWVPLALGPSVAFLIFGWLIVLWASAALWQFSDTCCSSTGSVVKGTFSMPSPMSASSSSRLCFSLSPATPFLLTLLLFQKILAFLSFSMPIGQLARLALPLRRALKELRRALRVPASSKTQLL